MAKKKKTRRRAAAKKRGRRGGGRPRKLAGVTLADLQAELHRRRTELQAQRDELAGELQRIDQELAEFGGAAAAPVRRGPGRPRKVRTAAAPAAAPARRRRRGRPRGSGKGRGRGQNKLSLVEALHQVLKGRTMSVTEVSQAVQDAGYKTSSANFRTIVNQALTANPDRFKKVARGQYTGK